MKQPLVGIRVVDISRLEVGAMATQVLADMGADVIKVEPPGPGEEIRQYVPRLGDDSAYAAASYRNKRSVQADLKTEGGRQVVYDLVQTADAFVEVSRKGVMERLGLDYPTLRSLNERLVYCACRAYGNEGPYAMQNSHSPDIDYYAGMATIEDDGQGGLRMADLRNLSTHAASLNAFGGILAGILGARLHGEGSLLEVSMWDSAVTLDGIRAAMALNGIWFPGGSGFGSRETPKHAPYATSDGKAIVISCVEPRYWRNFCEIIDRPELAELVEGGVGVTDFGSSFPQLYDDVAPCIAERTAAEWEKLLAAADVPFAVVKSRLEALESEHAQARDIVWTYKDSKGNPVRTVGRPFLLDGDRGSIVRPVPRPGAHTDEVLHELGYDPQRVGELRAAGAIG